ncbi:hypothetical protein RhiirA1_459269 [Rhizophagus irregularis]|uniref:DUF659 domain-containing protein n=1 Tax=Rhizophagus irregularis TaxID=588596 RepID=A0A2N0RTW9_9GLOM|nr:hypothetical protein RhiirA1_459269 [Rhizophagus irregularis]
MLSHAVVKIEDQVNSILEKVTNLTLGLDRWMNPSDLSIIKHMAQNLASEIKDILQKIGPDKFAAIVTDNAANCALARSIISEKYPFIVNIHCIAHCVNLITKDVFGKFLLIFLNYFINLLNILVINN